MICGLSRTRLQCVVPPADAPAAAPPRRLPVPRHNKRTTARYQGLPCHSCCNTYESPLSANPTLIVQPVTRWPHDSKLVTEAGQIHAFRDVIVDPIIAAYPDLASAATSVRFGNSRHS